MYLAKALMLVFVVDAARPKLFPVAKQHLHQLLASDPRLPLMVLANKQVSVTGGPGSRPPRRPPSLIPLSLLAPPPPLSGPPGSLRHHRPPRSPRPVGGRGTRGVHHRYPRQKGPAGALLGNQGRLGSDRPAGLWREIIGVGARRLVVCSHFHVHF